VKLKDMELPELRGVIYRAASEGVADAMRSEMVKISQQLEALHSHLDTVQRNVREELFPPSLRKMRFYEMPSGKLYTEAEAFPAKGPTAEQKEHAGPKAAPAKPKVRPVKKRRSRR